jgi:hypothetical protein
VLASACTYHWPEYHSLLPEYPVKVSNVVATMVSTEGNSIGGSKRMNATVCQMAAAQAGNIIA